MSSEADSTVTARMLERMRQGDRSALSRLLAIHRDYLKRLIDLRMDDKLRGRIDPSDVVQETQMVVTRRIDDFLASRHTSFRLWMRQQGLDQLIEHRRRHLGVKKRTLDREVRLSDASSAAISHNLVKSSPRNVAQRRELAQQVRQAIMELSDLDREVLLLRHVEELSNREVSELLEIKLETARKRHGRAFRRLCQKLVERGFAPQRDIGD